MSSKFCNSTNLERCLELLSQELNVLDYNYVLKSKENLSVNLINLSYDLLSDLKKIKIKCTKLTEENLRLSTLYNGAVLEKTKFEKLTAKKGESVCDLQDRIKALTLQKESAEKEMHKCKNEVNRLLKSSNVQRLQHEHDLRRKEQLIDRLKNQLEVYLDSDELEKAPAPQPNSLPSPTQPSRDDLELFIKTLQNNLQFTVAENANIRTFILNIYKLFFKLVKTNWPEPREFPLRTFSDAFLHYPSPDLLSEMEKNFELIIDYLSVIVTKNRDNTNHSVK